MRVRDPRVLCARHRPTRMLRSRIASRPSRRPITLGATTDRPRLARTPPLLIHGTTLREPTAARVSPRPPTPVHAPLRGRRRHTLTAARLTAFLSRLRDGETESPATGTSLAHTPSLTAARAHPRTHRPEVSPRTENRREAEGDAFETGSPQSLGNPLHTARRAPPCSQLRDGGKEESPRRAVLRPPSPAPDSSQRRQGVSRPPANHRPPPPAPV